MAGRFGLLSSNKAKDEQAAADKRLRRLVAKDEDCKPQEEEQSAADAAAGYRAKRQAKTGGRLAATKAKREAKAIWQREADESLAEAKEAWRREADERLSSLVAEWQAETDERLRATIAERQAEADDRLTAAEAEWRAEADRRLAEAKAAWQLKADERFASARTKWEQDAFERLSSLGAEWKAEADNRLAAARAEWQAEADKDLAAARTGWSQQAAQRYGAADRIQGGNAEVGTASSIGEEFAELFTRQQGVEDQGPETANVQQDPNRTDEKTAGVKGTFGRPWMWATAASIVLGLVFASSLTPVLDTVKSKLEPKEPPVAETVILYVETDIANIREKASTNSRIVSRVKYASKVTGVQRKGPWVKVITDGGKKPVGWIHASLLTPRKTQRR